MIHQNDEIQKRLFELIKEKLPPHISLADEIGSLLNISYDSVYRRLRGEKPISLNELQKLSTHFNISIDALFNVQTDTVIFHPGASSREAGMDVYLDGLYNDLSNVIKAKNKKILFNAKDIPLLYYFNFPELAWFKVFFWGKTILKESGKQKELFSLENLDKATIEKGRKTLALYNQVPSAEIWNQETANSTIRQIEFYNENGYFKNSNEVTILYEQLSLLMDHLKFQAEIGQKFLYNSAPADNLSNLDFYVNDVILGNTTLFVDADNHRRAFFLHDVLDFLITSDKNFCDKTYSILDNIIKKSSLVSVVNEKERNKFFLQIEKKIKNRTTEVNALSHG